MITDIAERYKQIRSRKDAAAIRSGRDPEEVVLMAVTKTHTPEEINQAIAAGATDAGENRVQELVEKYDKVDPVRWHLIGHLQTNKVRNIIDKVVMIHSVDSIRLAREINKRAGAAGLVMACAWSVYELGSVGAPVPLITFPASSLPVAV